MEKMDIAHSVLSKLRSGNPGENFDNPPQLTEEEKTRHAKLVVLKKGIIERAQKYIATPFEERGGVKYLLKEIQEIVDQVDDAFVLVVPQKDGTPYSITFNPNEEPSVEGGPSDIPE